MTRRTTRARRDNLGQGETLTRGTAVLAADLAAIRVEGNAMAPAYCDGDVVLYRRPDEHLILQPGDDVLVLLADPAGTLQLLLRRLARWDKEAMELQALNAGYLPIVEHPDHAVLCGKVVRRLA